jgi:hypothetical protein
MDLELTSEIRSLNQVLLGTFGGNQLLTFAACRGIRIEHLSVPPWIGKRFDTRAGTELYFDLTDFAYGLANTENSLSERYPANHLDNIFVLPAATRLTKLAIYTVSSSYRVYRLT